MPCAPRVFVAAAMILAAFGADAATLTRQATEGGAEIVLRGDIALEDADSLEALIGAIDEDGQTLHALRLDSHGGNLLGGIALARLIRQHGPIATSVESGAICASACLLAFSAGNPKFADYNSLVGVHGVADISGKTTEEARSATRIMAHISSELGVPSEITDMMLTTAPDRIAWLTSEELKSMGATMTGVPTQASTGLGANAEEGESLARQLRSGLKEDALRWAARGDYALAFSTWRQLAAEGDAASQYNLGEMYYAGRGVAQDYGEAAKWFQRAAEKGVPAAQLDLGVAFALGRGVPQDLERAYMWLSIAASTYASESERALAARARDLVSTRMTESELRDANRLTGGWARSR
ncbi:MAG TPA: hypothetical protein VKS78_05940 [Roseiarcus sp.]|nr:hypothetical protein [Roseiarcus sp.]